MVTMSDLRTEARELFAGEHFHPRNGLSMQLEFSPEALREFLSGRLDRLEICGDEAYQDAVDDRAILFLYIGLKG